MFDKLIGSLLGKSVQEPVVAIDIGSSAIKIMELDVSGDAPRLVTAASIATPAGAISNNVIVKQGAVADAIRSLIEANDVQSKQVVTCIPGPAAFSKKITMGVMDQKDLRSNISFEASNYIPHNIDAVHLDFQVLRRDSSSSMDVLLVAVKNEVVDSYVETIRAAELEPVVVDIDFYALENMFEVNYPDEREKTIALVNMGARFTSVNIMQGGTSLFTGDVGVGGRLYTDALCETLGMEPLQAEQTKMGEPANGFDASSVTETLERTNEHVASEMHRQLGFFWNAAGTDQPIDAIYLCGGGVQAAGLIEELSAKTGIVCSVVEALRNIEGLESFDKDLLEELAPSLSVSVGLATRWRGDKQHATS